MTPPSRLDSRDGMADTKPEQHVNLGPVTVADQRLHDRINHGPVVAGLPSAFPWFQFFGDANQNGLFPQQLPGPAQPAWDGEVPQQAVSEGPGKPVLAPPDKDDGADNSFLTFALPQALQVGASSDEATSTSLVAPHSTHKKSKRGMAYLFTSLLGLLSVLIQGLLERFDRQLDTMVFLDREFLQGAEHIAIVEAAGIGKFFPLHQVNNRHGGRDRAGAAKDLVAGVLNDAVFHFQTDAHGITA